MTFTIGERVRIIHACPPLPPGSSGTVVTTWADTCGVLLDADPDQLAASFYYHELERES